MKEKYLLGNIKRAMNKNKTKIIINLSNLKVNDDLKRLGVSETHDRTYVRKLLMFDENNIPDINDTKHRAETLINEALRQDATGVLLGCPSAQFILGYMEELCMQNGLDIYYPFFIKVYNDHQAKKYTNKIKGLVKKEGMIDG
jgi:hypothetical protein